MSEVIDRPRRLGKLGLKRTALLVITLMMSGRTMTVAFIGNAGSGGIGDPPAAWLMPLIGDAVIGITALLVGYLIVRRRGLTVWVTIVVWNVVGIWDTLSAYIVHLSVPWPEFFMIETFGAAMFFAAAAFHVAALWLVTDRELQTHFLQDPAR